MQQPEKEQEQQQQQQSSSSWLHTHLLPFPVSPYGKDADPPLFALADRKFRSRTAQKMMTKLLENSNENSSNSMTEDDVFTILTFLLRDMECHKLFFERRRMRINVYKAKNWSILDLFLSRGNVKVCELLIDLHKRFPKEELYRDFVDLRDSGFHNSPLRLACHCHAEKGNDHARALQLVKLLFESGITNSNKNQEMITRRTAGHWAVQTRNVDLLRYLLQQFDDNTTQHVLVMTAMSVESTAAMKARCDFGKVAWEHLISRQRAGKQREERAEWKKRIRNNFSATLDFPSLRRLVLHCTPLHEAAVFFSPEEAAESWRLPMIELMVSSFLRHTDCAPFFTEDSPLHYATRCAARFGGKLEEQSSAAEEAAPLKILRALSRAFPVTSANHFGLTSIDLAAKLAEGCGDAEIVARAKVVAMFLKTLGE